MNKKSTGSEGKVTTETPGERAARKWRAGTEAFLEEFQPVLDDVKQHAASMPHDTPEDGEKVMAYVIDRYKQFSEERRASHAEHKE